MPSLWQAAPRNPLWSCSRSCLYWLWPLPRPTAITPLVRYTPCLTMGETAISTLWKKGDKIKPYFVQGTAIVEGTEITLPMSIVGQQKKCHFQHRSPRWYYTANPIHSIVCTAPLSQIARGKYWLVLATLLFSLFLAVLAVFLRILIIRPLPRLRRFIPVHPQPYLRLIIWVRCR